jgi:hypothetical protein
MLATWDFRAMDSEVDMQVVIGRKMKIAPGFTLGMLLPGLLLCMSLHGDVTVDCLLLFANLLIY